MARIKEIIVTEKIVLDNFQDCKNIISEKIKELGKGEKHEGRDFVLKLLHECELYTDNSRSRVNGHYDGDKNRVVAKPRAIAFTMERMKPFLLHELCHLVVRALYCTRKGVKPHGKEFINVCAYIGYPNLSSRSSTADEKDYRDKEFFKNDVYGASNGNKYIIKCPKCGQIIAKYETPSLATKNPHWYSSDCCGVKLNKECVTKN